MRAAVPNTQKSRISATDKGVSSRLHNALNQEAYYAKIVARYMKFCAASAGSGGEGLERAFASLSVSASCAAADGGETTVSSTPTPDTSVSTSTSTSTRPSLPHKPSSSIPRPTDLPHILLAMRKLREGILGSRRRDAFAQRAYIFIIQAALLTQSWEAYHPALLYLLYTIHPQTPLASTELQDHAGYLVLDLACRRYELGEAFRVMRFFGVRDRKVVAVLKALVHDDWVRFWRLRRAVDGYQRAVMEFAVERMRMHALKCLGRSYLSVEKRFVERSADESWEGLVKGGVGWELQDDGRVIIRKPKGK